jgi:hypothetical protein
VGREGSSVNREERLNAAGVVKGRVEREAFHRAEGLEASKHTGVALGESHTLINDFCR